MRKKLLKCTLPLALLIYAGFRIGSRYVQFSDTLSIILCCISIALMMISIAYHSWCFGKRKNPYAK